jgi:hypothetical protein
MKLLENTFFFYRFIHCEILLLLKDKPINKEVATRKKLMKPILALIMGPSVNA